VRKLGSQMVERASDRDIDRETRNHLVFRVIVDALFSLVNTHQPAVPLASIQQMIRLVEPEVRAQAAEAASRCLTDSINNKSPTPEEIFRGGVIPFMTEVWPQERSLVTPSISRALADIPAASREEFANAVSLLSRFLVPFDCWSLLEFGLYESRDEDNPLELINDEAKAKALLDLLDLTVGTNEGAVVPYDLGKALEHLRSISPQLANSAKFRRLSAAARL